VKVYISGPISRGGTASIEEIRENVARFEDAAAWVRSVGDEPLSPIQPQETDEKARLSWEENMRLALRLLLDASAIMMLPGWSGSKGAWLEYKIAAELGYHMVVFPS